MRPPRYVDRRAALDAPLTRPRRLLLYMPIPHRKPTSPFAEGLPPVAMSCPRGEYRLQLPLGICQTLIDGGGIGRVQQRWHDHWLR
jgi:hypothetical protein